MNQEKEYTTTLGDHTITVRTGKLAQQAGGAVTISSGDTMLLVAATMSAQEREGISFFPLTVDFEERLYAAGRIPGSFFRREGRPTESAILTSRLTDRSLRPLFPKDMRNDVQVIITPLSQGEEQLSDILAIIGASTALTISDTPFGGPVGAVRIAYIDDQLVINPTISEMENSTLDLRMAGTADAMLMVEAGALEVPEDVMLQAFELGQQAIQEVIALQNRMREEIGKPKRSYNSYAVPEDLVGRVEEIVGDRLRQALYDTADKSARYDAIRALRTEAEEQLAEEYTSAQVRDAFNKVESNIVRRHILEQSKRVDGREPSTLRSLTAEVGLLPRAHGSGLFSRGETQVLSVATLGTPREEQMLDDLSPEETKRYIHHYNFPPYSTGETRPLRGPRRREIGHGALAERALLSVIPNEEQFPYTIRVVSDVMSSNGSTSMASVCGSSLSLMDAGVPIRTAVAGIAMGLIKGEEQYQILTDIMGLEDHVGDMDFKVAGTEKGITALQMDIKIKGISGELLAEALGRAREVRMEILNVMNATISAPREELSPQAPQMITIQVDPDKLGAVIGSGGKTVRSIQEEFDVRVDIEDDGTIFIAATDGQGVQRAKERIERLTEEAELGKIYTGRVVRITDFGAFVEILPGTDGLVHISQLSDRSLSSVRDAVNINDEILVMVTDIGPNEKIRLSRRAVLEGWTLEEARQNDRPSRGRSSRGRRSSRG